ALIISPHYLFILLHTQKSAGTSIDIALSKFCGEDDIITPISSYDEPKRVQYGSRGPQNCFVSYSKYSCKDWIQSFIERKRRRFYNHIPAYDIRRWIGEEIWKSYYKFCFERNPWDKAISRYSFCAALSKKKISPEEFLWKKEEIPNLSNYPIYTIDDKVVVDRVCYFENLSQEIEDITCHLGLPEVLVLPKAKVGFRKDKRPYQEIIGKKERGLIQTLCQKEIDLFGYTFDASPPHSNRK
ncbi:MAG: hypothetical protein ACQ9MH_18430, partial [Nitrospinales bacterium]